MERGTEVALDVAELQRVLVAAREFSPRLARELRRDLRSAGTGVIARQKAILAGPLPMGVAVTGKRMARIQARGKRKAYLRIVNTYGDTEVKRPGRSTDLRDRIAAGLKTRIVTGKTRQGFEVKTTGPRDAGYNMAKVWNRRRFRHPVFDSSQWVYQAGQPYFWGPVYDGGIDEMRQRASEAISRTLAAMSKE